MDMLQNIDSTACKCCGSGTYGHPKVRRVWIFLDHQAHQNIKTTLPFMHILWYRVRYTWKNIFFRLLHVARDKLSGVHKNEDHRKKIWWILHCPLQLQPQCWTADEKISVTIVTLASLQNVLMRKSLLQWMDWSVFWEPTLHFAAIQIIISLPVILYLMEKVLLPPNI